MASSECKTIKNGSGSSTIQVIGAGFGRTGTLSLKRALDILLKGNCYHMNELMKEDETPQPSFMEGASADPVLFTHSEAWLDIGTNNGSFKNVKIKALLKDYVAIVDFPSSVFYNELFQAYPNSKVILTVRDKERWYKSTDSTIYSPQKSMWTRFKRKHLTWSRKRLHYAMVRATFWDYPTCFNGQFADKEYTLKMWDTWVETCHANIPKDRLLVFSVKEGWAPLCEFLGVPVPSEEFPRSNNFKEWNSIHHLVAEQRAKTSRVLRYGALVLSAGVAMFKWRNTLFQMK